MLLTSAMRKLHGHDLVHYIPQHLSQWSRHILETNPSIDIFWGTCSLPNAHGCVNLGLGACYEEEIIRNAKIVILEINPNMPVTHGATFIPLNDVHYFINANYDIPSLPKNSFDKVTETIGQNVSELVEDGSTIQLGIGEIPDAIGKCLRHKKDLGVHTELLSDAIWELYEQGCITGRRKTLWPERMVASFILGSPGLYNFVNDNPLVELHPSSIVNDSNIISQNYKMVSLNTAIEIDLTGQVCAESIGHVQLSGVGGATDTHVGASRAKGGKGIIAMKSTTDNGLFSKICFELHPGAKVSVTRNDIDIVVTEYGIAKLRGKSVAARIGSLISIAHPQFRDELFFKAQKADYL